MQFPSKTAIAEKLCSYLQERGLLHTFHEQEDVIHWNLSIRGRLRSVTVLVQLYDRGYSTNLLLPISADMNNPEEVTRALHFLNRINDSLREGNLEMDPDDGSMCLRYYTDCEFSQDLPAEQIQKSIFLPVQILERYGEGFAQVLLNAMPEEEAFRLCRKNLPDTREQPEEEEEETTEEEDEEESFGSFRGMTAGFFDGPDFEPIELPEEEPEDPEEAQIRSICADLDNLLERLRTEYPEE